MEKFKSFSTKYENMQASRLRTKTTSSPEDKEIAQQYGQRCSLLFDKFFNHLNEEEKDELIEKVDSDNLTTQAIMKEARERGHIPHAK